MVAAIGPALLLSGCLRSTALLKVNADGSGTVENQIVMTSASLAQVRQLAGLFGGSGTNPVDPFSEQQARDLARQMGDGVTLVSTRPLRDAGGEGREAIYAFPDVTKLRLSEAPAAPGDTSLSAGGLNLVGRQASSVTIDRVRTADGLVRLTFHTTADQLSGLTSRLGSPAGPGSTLPADQMTMVRQMLGGLRVALRVQPAGRLIRTSSPYVDGQIVTLFDFDLDALLNDEAALARLQAAKTAGESAEALKGVKGIKVNLERDITIEFAP